MSPRLIVYLGLLFACALIVPVAASSAQAQANSTAETGTAKFHFITLWKGEFRHPRFRFGAERHIDEDTNFNSQAGKIIWKLEQSPNRDEQLKSRPSFQ